MCGIIGYAGGQNTTRILLDGLKKLEYRGYDSAGIALGVKDHIEIYKTRGKVVVLERLLSSKKIPTASLKFIQLLLKIKYQLLFLQFAI